jgi:hypothetical protein
MTEPPRRHRFQIHLSTAVVLMFVAGGLIWANVTEQPHPIYQETDHVRMSGYGLPIQVQAFYYGGFVGINPIQAAADIVFALGTLFATWFLCEWLIRRRVARKGT